MSGSGILGFAKELVSALVQEALPANILNEQDFERRFIVPIASRIIIRHPRVSLYTHPFSSRICCAPECSDDSGDNVRRVIGCPKCWAASKSWASVAAFGTHHTFDMAARDQNNTLALELKLAAVRGGRMPNGKIQRFLGQCLLAGTKHSVVIGVLCYRGKLQDKWHSDTSRVIRSLKNQNVCLVFRDA